MESNPNNLLPIIAKQTLLPNNTVVVLLNTTYVWN